MNSIKSVGITGGIGTGKSLVCRILNIMGYPVFYSDNEARIILDTDAEAIAEVKKTFGEQAYLHTGLNRPYISQKVFEQPDLREKLNAIAHPLVRKQFEAWKIAQNSPLVFNEAAILFETGGYKNNDFNVLVTSPEPLRMARLKARDGSTEEQVKKRMAAQWSDDKKIPLADFVIVNDEKQLLIPQVIEMVKKLNA